jgi:DNA-binding CsgD family transcriptional regulator
MGWVMFRGMSRAAISPNGRVLRHPGDLEWLERRRMQAADLFAQGKTRAEVASELGVSAQADVHRRARRGWLPTHPQAPGALPHRL